MLRTSARISALKPTAVNSVLADIRAVQAQGRKVIALMRGEPDFPTPEHIADAAVSALRNGRTGYPDNRGEMDLRIAVTEKLFRDNGIAYDPGAEILITDGATMGIYAALMATLNEGDEILLPNPIYDAYQSAIRVTGARPRAVRSHLKDGRFHFDADALEEAWTPSARVLLVNTPWNPVGTVLSRDDIAHIANFVERHNLILISDEIYECITYDGHRHVSPAAVSNDIRARCILVNSFSKTYAMTGWRLGYCAGPRDVIQSMFLILQQASRGPATFIQDAGTVALRGPQSCVEEMRRIYAERRSLLIDRLSGIPNVSVVPPEGGFFCLLDTRSLDLPSNELRCRLLRDFGVAVIHGAAYGDAAEGTLRVSFASGGENLAQGLEALRHALLSIAVS